MDPSSPYQPPQPGIPNTGGYPPANPTSPPMPQGMMPPPNYQQQPAPPQSGYYDPQQQPQQPVAAPAPTVTAPKAQQTPKAKKKNPNSTQNSLQIAEIRDGIVIMNDGSFRTVLMVKSINFDLMSPQEREAVEFSYQGFLNSLYFPIQIFVRSQKVDLTPYLEKLDKIRTEHENMLLALLMEDYISFMDELAAQTNIMDKKFYVVIPFYPSQDMQRAVDTGKKMFANKKAQQHVVINEADLEKGKAELRNRVQAVLGALMQCGVQGLPLDTQELIELYYDTYNPDTATRQQLKNFNDLTAPVVTKGEGMARQPNLERELK